MRKIILAGMVLSISAWSTASAGWNADEVAELEPQVAATIEAIKEKDEGMQSFFDKAVGYAVFP